MKVLTCLVTGETDGTHRATSTKLGRTVLEQHLGAQLDWIEPATVEKTPEQRGWKAAEAAERPCATPS